MVELVDELVDTVEARLVKVKIELTAQELNYIKDALDSVLVRYEEKIHGIE